MPPSGRANSARWHSSVDVLALIRREPGITRAGLARRLNLSSGSTTEITARLRELRLLAEEPAVARGRGRPTTVLRPHPEGPLVLVVDIRHGDWRSALASVDGSLDGAGLQSGPHASSGELLAAVRQVVERARDRHPRRLRAVSVAVAGTVRAGRLTQASTLGWGPVDLTGLTVGTGLDLLVGNDATLAGVAETRTGAAREVRTALHLTVEVGIGGALVVDGRPVVGSGGGGEYGHLPFGDRSLRCPCGARGCWDLEVDGRALARHLGEDPGADPRGYALDVLERASHATAAARAVRAVAAALGAGIAGLVNAHDPDLVTLGGLAGPLRAAGRAGFDAAYADGLMTFHRQAPPPIRHAVHGAAGALHGAAAVGLDHITREAALAAWARDRA